MRDIGDVLAEMRLDGLAEVGVPVDPD